MTDTGHVEDVPIGPDLILLTRRWDAEEPRAVIVLVHGAADHSGRWGHVGGYFADAGFDVHGYDMRGHGRSGGRPMFAESFDDFLDDLEVMVERARRKKLPVFVYGHSFGGLVAAAYGVGERPQPDAYVLSAPALGSTTPRILRAVAFVLGGIMPTLTAPTVFKKEQLSRDPDVGDAYLADPHVHRRSTLRLGREAFKAMGQTEARLSRLTAPTLVVHGEADTLVPVGFSEAFAALPNVERRVFPDLRHEMHNEPESGEVLAYIRSWIDAAVSA